MDDIEFTGQWARDPETFGVFFQATVNGQMVRCRVTTEALEDIDPSNIGAEPEDQFQQNQASLQAIAEQLIRGGRITNGELTITAADVR